MGDVYRATDTKLGRAVALKVISAEMAAHPDRLDRFRREAKALEWAARVADQRNPICFQSTIRPFQHVLSRSPRWPALLQKLNLSR
jgi:serine/threonine protein kinase